MPGCTQLCSLSPSISLPVLSCHPNPEFFQGHMCPVWVTVHPGRWFPSLPSIWVGPCETILANKIKGEDAGNASLRKFSFPDERNKHIWFLPSPLFLPILNTAMMYRILAANLWLRAQENYRDASTKVINQPAATYVQPLWYGRKINTY